MSSVEQEVGLENVHGNLPHVCLDALVVDVKEEEHAGVIVVVEVEANQDGVRGQLQQSTIDQGRENRIGRIKKI